ncbi:MAG: hypothetical protein RLZZ463_1466, partial [Bacteroidota bacterium]
MKVKTILVSQPEPKAENSPYQKIVDAEKIKIDFRPFIHVEGVDAKEVRQQKIDLSQYTAVIFTSRNSIDHYFRMAEEMRFKVPDTMRYFCQSEAVAFYLQKYVVYRKRKIYVGKIDFPDLAPLFKKYKEEKFLLPSSDVLKPEVPQTLDGLKLNWTRGIFYRTVMSDLSDLRDVYYDILVFFSPAGIESLKKNFPDFEQNNTRYPSILKFKGHYFIGNDNGFFGSLLEEDFPDEFYHYTAIQQQAHAWRFTTKNCFIDLAARIVNKEAVSSFAEVSRSY